MEYPLNLTLAIGIGFAVASDEAEHIALSDLGYVPAFPGREIEPASPEVASEKEALKQRAELVGLKTNGTWGLKRLTEEVEKAEGAAKIEPASPEA